MKIVLADWVEKNEIVLAIPISDNRTDLTSEEYLRNSPYVAAFRLTNFSLP